MSEPAKRAVGRPKGSKNKRKNLTGATIEQICIINNHHPTEFLVQVAKGRTVCGFVPTRDEQLSANKKLHDAIHENHRLLAAVDDEGATVDGQYTILFEEEADSFTLPGQADAEGVAQAMRTEPLQRAGDSPESGQDSVCDQ